MRYGFCAVMAPIAVLVSSTAFAQSDPAQPTVTSTSSIVLPPNTEVVVTPNDTLTTRGKALKEGSKFRISTLFDVMQDGYVLIPKGTMGEGTITWMTNKGAFGKSGKMEVSLARHERSPCPADRQVPAGRPREHWGHRRCGGRGWCVLGVRNGSLRDDRQWPRTSRAHRRASHVQCAYKRSASCHWHACSRGSSRYLDCGAGRGNGNNGGFTRRHASSGYFGAMR